MTKSYAISVKFSPAQGNTAPERVTLYMSANNAGLTALLQALDASPAIESMTLSNTITIPPLHNVGHLNCNDAGLDAELKKLL